MSDQPQPGDIWYRYEDVQYASIDEFENVRPGRLAVERRELTVARVTPKGVWLAWSMYISRSRTNKDPLPSGARFVLRTARKQYACRTKEEALAAFIARKTRQARILKHQLDRANQAIRMGQQMRETECQNTPKAAEDCCSILC